MRSSEPLEAGGAPVEWSDRPAGLRAYLGRIEEAPDLQRMLPEMLNEVRELLAHEWPDYATFLAREHSEVTVAAEAFVRWLVDSAEHGLDHAPHDPTERSGTQLVLFEEIGRIQWREGREVSS